MIEKWEYRYILKVETEHVLRIYEWMLTNKSSSPFGRESGKNWQHP